MALLFSVYVLTQCYLPRDTSEHAPLNPIQ